MSQPNAAYMLAYMGLFLGIDASRQLDDAEKAHFRQRYELLKSQKQIASSAQVTPQTWQALRGYYLGLARYPFVSGEKALPLEQAPVEFADQGVTLVKVLQGGGIAVGGGISGTLFVLGNDLTIKARILLDSPPVHLEERTGKWYVLTLGSLLGALGAESRSSLYRIDPATFSATRLVTGLPRAAHFLIGMTNADAVPDFIVAGFGSVTGGGLVLVESAGNSYQHKVLSRHDSFVRLAKISERDQRIEFFALTAGAREELLYIQLETGQARERVLEAYPPHLGSVGLELSDVDGDGRDELLVLSGDNADSGPYNEAKPDQGLRIYTHDNGQQLRQVHFESLPGALTMSVDKYEDKQRIVVARYYSDPLAKQDLTVLTLRAPLKFERSHFTLQSRPTVLALLKSDSTPGYLLGSGNFPILALQDEKPVSRSFNGPVLSVVRPKLGNR